MPRNRGDDPSEEVQVLLSRAVPYPGPLAPDKLDGLFVVEGQPIGQDVPVPCQKLGGVHVAGSSRWSPASRRHGSSSVSSPSVSGLRSRRNCHVLRPSRFISRST